MCRPGAHALTKKQTQQKKTKNPKTNENKQKRTNKTEEETAAEKHTEKSKQKMAEADSSQSKDRHNATLRPGRILAPVGCPKCVLSGHSAALTPSGFIKVDGETPMITKIPGFSS